MSDGKISFGEFLEEIIKSGYVIIDGRGLNFFRIDEGAMFFIDHESHQLFAFTPSDWEKVTVELCYWKDENTSCHRVYGPVKDEGKE